MNSSSGNGSVSYLIIIVLLAMSIALMGGLLVRGTFNAEAVIGGPGNLGTNPNNVHNLSSTATHGGIKAQSETQICIFCHTPHHAYTGDATLLNAPLWNHTMTSASYYINGMVTDALFNTATISPDGASKLCMSCHDGTVAIGSVYSRDTTIAMSGACLTGSGALSTSCTGYLGPATSHHIFSVPMNDQLIADSLTYCKNHPGSMKLVYPWLSNSPDQADVLLRPTTHTYAGQLGVARTTPPYSAGYSYGVQCTSCHDPHEYTTDSFGNSCDFLVGSSCPTTSTDNLCYSCHSTICQ